MPTLSKPMDASTAPYWNNVSDEEWETIESPKDWRSDDYVSVIRSTAIAVAKKAGALSQRDAEEVNRAIANGQAKPRVELRRIKRAGE